MPCHLKLSRVPLLLKIGCHEDERLHPQVIHLTVVIRCAERFLASHTDQLKDTMDIGAIRKRVMESTHEWTKEASVDTLERLGQLLETAYKSS